MPIEVAAPVRCVAESLPHARSECHCARPGPRLARLAPARRGQEDHISRHRADLLSPTGSTTTFYPNVLAHRNLNGCTFSSLEKWRWTDARTGNLARCSVLGLAHVGGRTGAQWAVLKVRRCRTLACGFGRCGSTTRFGDGLCNSVQADT